MGHINGLPLSDSGSITTGKFGWFTDGLTLAYENSNGCIRFWECPKYYPNQSSSLVSLAQAISGMRIDSKGFESLLNPDDQFSALQVALRRSRTGSAPNSWLDWFFNLNNTNKIQFFSQVSRTQYVERFLRKANHDEMLEAFRLAPYDPLILERLAKNLGYSEKPGEKETSSSTNRTFHGIDNGAIAQLLAFRSAFLRSVTTGNSNP